MRFVYRSIVAVWVLDRHSLDLGGVWQVVVGCNKTEVDHSLNRVWYNIEAKDKVLLPDRGSVA